MHKLRCAILLIAALGGAAAADAQTYPSRIVMWLFSITGSMALTPAPGPV
jgi:hypothetical protein